MSTVMKFNYKIDPEHSAQMMIILWECIQQGENELTS